MKRILYLLIILSISFEGFTQLLPSGANSASFIKGQFVEIGVCRFGAFGTYVDAPAGYHPRGSGNRLGFVADIGQDGWNIGTPDYMGDYFLPGSPQEGWDIQVGTLWSRAWRSGPGGTAPSASIVGDNVSIDTIGSEIHTTWEGTISGTLGITQTTILDTNRLFFVVEVVLVNNGTTTTDSIYYDRTVDPDNDQPLSGGSFTTTNTIVYQPDLITGDNKCLVSAVGPTGPEAYLGLGTVDCRAKSYIIGASGGGFLYPTTDIKSIFNGAGGGTSYLTAVGQSNVMDRGIGLIFELGTIAPGETASFAYAYILSQAQLDSAFQVLNGNWEVNGGTFINGDTLEICRGSDLDISITGGNTYVWGDWTPSTHLEYTSGRDNIIHVDNTMTTTTYTVVGTTPICPTSDTLVITIVPVGDSTIINEEICAGNVFDFDGTMIYNTGTYFKTYVTNELGCDSVVQLNLTVNPLPDVDVIARETDICEGDEALLQIASPSNNTNYQWYRNGIAIAGATDNQYLASTAGEYRLVGVTNKGCSDTSRRISIIVNPAASANILDVDYGKVCIGDTLKFEAELFQNHEYRWSPEKYFRYTVGYKNPIAYGIMDDDNAIITLMTINQYGCKAFDSVNVVAVPCCEALMPTVFSPNGDGKNDMFNIKLLNHQKVVNFQIFNRRGNIVYNNNDPKNGWNGLIENTGDEVQQATYFYRIVYTCTDGANYELKGDITIVR